MQRIHRECGEIGEMNLAGQPVVMLFGEKAHEAFFRAPDEQLDQAAAYPFMTPVFGRGVVFDASPEQRKQAIKNRSLRDKMMRGHAEVIADETGRMIAGLGESGEIDLLDFFAELTLYTSSSCLIGREFREELSSELVPIFQDLERGTDAFAYVNPYLPLPSFRKRDRARQRLVEIIEGIIARRKAEGRETRDLVQVLTTLRNEDGTPRYSADQITGMFISMMFAGHHTTSGTAAWTLIELLRHEGVMKRVVAELDELYADGREVSYQALRDIPELECTLKEALRLHPPLIILMRKVQREFEYGGVTVDVGKTVAVSPAVSNRMPEYFPDPGSRLRHDAAQGHLQRAAAGVRVRDGAARRQLPERPLEDGGAAPAAVPRALPAPRGAREGRGGAGPGGAGRRVRRARRRPPASGRGRGPVPGSRRLCERVPRDLRRRPAAHEGEAAEGGGPRRAARRGGDGRALLPDERPLRREGPRPLDERKENGCPPSPAKSSRR
jgi:sterol 14-demethylase